MADDMAVIHAQYDSFLAAISQQRGGDLAADCNDKMREVVEAIRETGKAGSLTLTLKFKPVEEGDGTAVKVNDTISVKIPQPSLGVCIFYTNDTGGLQRADPRQREFKGAGFDRQELADPPEPDNDQ